MNALLQEFGLNGPDFEALKRKHSTPHSRFVKCMGLDVHVSIEGQGPDVVMVHGFAASLHTWDDVARELVKQHRVIRFDLPPFGLTGPVLDESGKPRKLDVAFYQTFVDALLDTLDVKRCVMIGNSFGGFLSWDQAQRHPERVRGAVLSDSVAYQQPLPIYIKLFTIAPIAGLVKHSVPAFLLRMAIRDVYGDASKIKPFVLKRYLELFMHKPNRSAVPGMVGVFTDGELGAHRLPDIKVPCLIVWGDADRWVKPEMGERMHKDIPGSRLIRYPGVGHIPMEETPEQFACDCMEFISTLPGA
ncbi:MAG: alpha/beta fold hydrolase [Limnobacter sp.]|uniref:alpha/beta fold hydrolase n=1 Tax=Limnobacter sp. TaxID=2003368 RepID=UPI0039189840